MDVQMPRLNGFEVTARLRDDPETARIPVIFVTAAAREPVRCGARPAARRGRLHSQPTIPMNSWRGQQQDARPPVGGPPATPQRGTEALVRIGGELNQRLGLEELTELILVIARDEFQADHVEMFLFDDQQNPILYRDIVHGTRDLHEAEQLLVQTNSLAGRVYHVGNLS